MGVEEDAGDPRAREPSRSDRRWLPRVVAWLVGALVLGAAVVAVTAAVLRGSRGGTADATASAAGLQPAVAETRDDLFVLTIQSERSRYAVNEPIAFETTLVYVGAPEQVTVTSSGGGLVGFSIEQLDGPVDALGGRDSDCREFQYRRGDLERIRFQKSGGFSNTDPMAAFWRAFYADPQLRLPAGEYRITAQALYAGPGCGEGATLEASIQIQVE
jgi:hypothetical protein